MRKRRNYFWILLALVLLLAGCGKDETPVKGSSVQIVESGDRRFLLVTLEGNGADSALVRVVKAQKNDDGEYIDGEITELSRGEDGVCCGVFETGGEYLLQVLCEDGTDLKYLFVFDESQVCSFHICLDAKESDGTRTLWPYTPHNSPDSQ